MLDVMLEVDIEECVRKSNRKLSTVSKMYDIDGDGKLDAAEMAMRDMDKSNRGYLSNETVYKLMKEQMETQKQLFRVLRVMFVLLALVVILALANLGTSFAAASLAKDTTTSTNAELLDKNTQEGLNTQTATEEISFERTVEIAEDGTRRLCSKEDGDVDCTLRGESTFLSIEQKMCRKMIKKCNRGNSVSLSRTWPNGDTSKFNVCPYDQGRLSRSNVSTLVNNKGHTFRFEAIESGHCQISGDAVQQREGETCGVADDCAPGLGCVEVQAFIERCKAGCAHKRWAPRYVTSCQNDCDHPSCQSEE
jgi:hypothetical protein